MRWPWVSRKWHEALMQEEWRLRGIATNTAVTAHKEMLATRDECERLRQERTLAENKCATLDGQLTAERHRQGLPAAVDARD